MKVKRIFVKKRDEFNIEANELLTDMMLQVFRIKYLNKQKILCFQNHK